MMIAIDDHVEAFWAGRRQRRWDLVWDSGFSAKRDGMPSSANPHQEGTDPWYLWFYGWQAGR